MKSGPIQETQAFNKKKRKQSALMTLIAIACFAMKFSASMKQYHVKYFVQHNLTNLGHSIKMVYIFTPKWFVTHAIEFEPNLFHADERSFKNGS